MGTAIKPVMYKTQEVAGYLNYLADSLSLLQIKELFPNEI